MTKKKKVILTVLGSVIVSVVALLGALIFVDYKDVQEFMRDVRGNTGPAAPYQPACGAVSAPVCTAWTEFRHSHPFPYQAVAAKTLDASRFLFIVSEPPPQLTRDATDALIRDSFDKPLAINRLRWYIGADGWVEDAVFEVSVPSTSAAPLENLALRDSIARLHSGLFGTTFGGDLEIVSEPRSIAKAAFNLRVSPAEVAAWLEDSTRRWSEIDSDEASSTTWSELTHSHAVGTLISNDHAQVMLTFPTSYLERAKRDPNSLEPLRIPFRQFAVASDTVFAGVWTKNGQAAFLARVRTQSPTIVPPLRFETFALLASESADELAQSYERNTPFAGKLGGGTHRYRDWAPVYLSRSLIDTEFGALLNITDQMLKSWSEAGHVEYLYFNYPKPAPFPFREGVQERALSEVLRSAYGSVGVLFNWNTSGAAVVVNHGDMDVLVANQTGALPVTYGADGKSQAEGGRDVLQYEDTAYDYFGNVRDPNLARVVQYTTLYQTFRAIAAGDGTEPQRDDIIPARAQATSLLAQAAGKLLDDVEAGRITEPKELVDGIRSRRTRVREAFPQLNNELIGQVLVDRGSQAAREIRAKRGQDLQERADALEKAGEQLEGDIDKFNQLIDRLNTTRSTLSRAAMEVTVASTRESLRHRQVTFEAEQASFEREIESGDPIVELGKHVAEIAPYAADLEEIRTAYVAANAEEPRGSIKTPSIVLSWDREQALASVGGHNVNAGALHLKPTPGVEGVKIVRDGRRLTLQYDPARANEIESHAGGLARAIEHRGVRDVADLMKLTERPVEIRTPKQALEFDAASERRPVFGELGRRLYEGQDAFAADLKALVETNECCVFMKRDVRGVMHVAEPVASPPPLSRIVEIRDTPSVSEYLASRAKGRDNRSVVFLDEPPAHVDALLESAGGGGGRKGRASWAVTAGADPGKGQTIFQSDLRGRRSQVSIVGVFEAKVRSVTERVMARWSPQVWRQARATPMTRESVEELLKPLNWNQATDGVPNGIIVSFGVAEGLASRRASIIAGFATADSGSAARLGNAHLAVQSAATVNGASLSQYLATIRNELAELPKSQLRTLWMVVEDDLGTTLMTRIGGVAETMAD